MVLYHLPLQMVTELIQTGTPLNRSVMLKFGSNRQGAKRRSFYRRALKPGSRFVRAISVMASKIFAHSVTALSNYLRCVAIRPDCLTEASKRSIADQGRKAEAISQQRGLSRGRGGKVE